jgi:formylmethanofuran:tetrahydromethanopterin formyltransferase
MSNLQAATKENFAPTAQWVDELEIPDDVRAVMIKECFLTGVPIQELVRKWVLEKAFQMTGAN